MKRLFGLVIIVAVAASALRAGDAMAQNYPSKPVRIIVPFAAGGAVDVLARLLGGKLQEAFHQPVIVENKPGAGGNLGADLVAKSAPDGYTLLLTPNGQAISPSLYRNLPYDGRNDLAPVTQVVASNLVLVASPRSPIKSVRELIALAKAKPGSLNYGSSGIGNPLHLTMEMFKHAAGIEIVAIPYKSDAEINTALISGEVHVAVIPLASGRQLIESGQLRALGVTGAQRASVTPDIPTIAEEGVAGFASASWQGLFMAAKTPRDIIGTIQRETALALQLPDVRERIRGFAYEPVGSTPEEFANFFKSEIDKFAQVVRDAHIPMQD